MMKKADEYFEALKVMFDGLSATDIDGKAYSAGEAIEESINMIMKQTSFGGKLFLIGNGASASIASHMATDFWKNASIRAHAFNDSALLTCISNDYGYRHVFEKPIEMFTEPGDVLISISSSGQSENILRAVSAAKKRKVKVVTLSGFDEENPLRKVGDINFYVPASEYGYVEVVHHSICHCMVDLIIARKINDTN